nr:MAG TPA: hypothetical protein [Caudoviricetes sp.]
MSAPGNSRGRHPLLNAKRNDPFWFRRRSFCG